MISGAGVLDAERLAAGTPYSQFALLVMTDGNQNVTPYVQDPPVTSAIAPYASTVYAIGLGTPGNVSDTTLGQIANYMLVTGDMTAAARRFRLTKYFVQILAGVTRTAIVVDPQGDLHVGSEHRIPFLATEADVELDVIALCPLAPLLEFELEAPDGTRIGPGFGAPTVVFRGNREDAFYRLSLPVDPGIRAAGEWNAILRLSKRSLARRSRELEQWAEVLAQLRRLGTLPYSLVVQSYSNLELAVYVKPTVAVAGDRIDLYALLSEYQRPSTDNGAVSVAVTGPLGGTITVSLQPTRPGQFEGSFTAHVPGLYDCRFLATGTTGQGQSFQREETRSVSAFKGRIPVGMGDDGDDMRGHDHSRDPAGKHLDVLLGRDRGAFCRLLDRAGSDPKIAKRLGIDQESAKSLHERCCRDELG